MIGRRTKPERLRVVIGLSAAGMTYEEMTRYIGVNSRQRVQQLVVNAVAKLPQLAHSLGVTGRRHPGRLPKDGSIPFLVEIPIGSVSSFMPLPCHSG